MSFTQTSTIRPAQAQPAVLLLKATDLAVFYTADLYVPAEQVEGETSVRSGWYDQDWCATAVYDDRDSVRADTPCPELEGTPHGVPLGEALIGHGGSPVQWLAARLAARLGAVEEYTGGGSVYAANAHDVDLYAGITARVAAHPQGFTDAQISAAVRLVNRR